MNVATPIGSCRTTRVRRFKRRPYSHVRVELTFNASDGRLMSLSRDFHSITKRSEVDQEWLQGAVAKMIESRDDLESLELRSVNVVGVERIWDTSYQDLYPEEKEG